MGIRVEGNVNVYKQDTFFQTHTDIPPPSSSPLSLDPIVRPPMHFPTSPWGGVGVAQIGRREAGGRLVPVKPPMDQA